MDESELKCLPRNFLDNFRRSRRIEALYQKRKIEEKRAIHELHAKKREICYNYSKVLQELGQELNQGVQEIQDLIVEELHEFQLETTTHFMSQQHLKSLQAYSVHQNQLVDSFYDALTRMEIEKSMEISDAMKLFYQEIQRISNRLPQECDEQIEMELEKINQSILCNHRNYVELKAKLQSNVQNLCKLSIQQLQMVQERRMKLAPGQSELQQIAGTISSSTSISTMNKTPQQWLEGLRQTLANLDQKAQKVTLSYKQAAVLIYNRFFPELKRIEETLRQMPDLQVINEDQTAMYTPNLEEIPILYGTTLDAIQPVWTSWVKKLGQTFTTTCQFLDAAVRLWKQHFVRTQKLRLVMLQDLENTVKLNNKLGTRREIKLNLLIDTLRQAPTTKKAKKAIEAIEGVLEAVGELYEEQYQSEVAILKQYKSLLDLKVEVLMAEVKRFLKIHPPDGTKDPKRQTKRASQTSNEPMNPLDALLPNQMVFCGYQIAAISNWQFGVWEMISNYLAGVKAELLSEDEQWFQKQAKRLDQRKKIRLTLHSGRLWTIQSCIYKERLKELCLHNQRLGEHKTAVQQGLSQLDSQMGSWQEGYDAILRCYDSELSEIEGNSLDSTSSAGVRALGPILNGKSAKCCDEINSKTADIHKKCQAFVLATKASHALLLKEAKLFADGGSFSAAETQIFLTEVIKLEEQIEKATSSLWKQLERYKMSMLEKMQTKDAETKSTLKSILEEHVFMENLHSRHVAIQKKILTEVCRFQNQNTQLYSQFERFKVVMLENCGKICFFKQFADQMTETARKLLEIAGYFEETAPVKLYSEKADAELRRLGSSSKKRRRSAAAQVQDATNRLFNLEFDDGQNTYLANVNRMLLTNWDDTIAYANQFFAQHHHCFFLDGDKVVHNVTILLKNLYSVYLKMQNQCETRAMQDAKTFIHFTSNYLSFLDEYIDMYMDEFERAAIKNYEQFFEIQIKQDFEKSKEDIRSLYTALYKKLRPLHGHPKNKSKLKSIQVEADKVWSESKNIIGQLGSLHLTKLAQEFEKVLEEYRALYEHIPNVLQIKDSLQNAADDLARKLNEKEVLLRKMLDCPPRAYPKEILSHCKSFLLAYESRPSPGYQDVKWNYFQKLALSAHSMGLNSISLESSLIGDAECDPFHAQLKARLNKYSRLVQKEDFQGFLKTLKAEWNCAVKTVLELYDVKYH